MTISTTRSSYAPEFQVFSDRDALLNSFEEFLVALELTVFDVGDDLESFTSCPSSHTNVVFSTGTGG